jgi:transcriptional regulator GlxA family with amidase domain
MTVRIRVLAYDGCLGTELFGFSEGLMLANHLVRNDSKGRKPPPFDVQIVSVGPTAPVGATGIAIHGAKGFPAKADLLVIPGFDFAGRADMNARLTGLRRETGAIAQAFARGIPVASICVGAFLLGEAGLLKGRQATTAWMFAGLLAKRYPEADVSPTSLLVEDDKVITTGAFSAAFDLVLEIVSRFAGERIARQLGKMALLATARSSQLPYVDRALVPRSPHRFADDVQKWLLRHLSKPYDLDRLASALHVSSRTLLRRFKAETGQSPLSFLQQARVEKAKLLLETTRLALGEILELVGYRDESTFRTLFVRSVGVSPAAYRRQFQQKMRRIKTLPGKDRRSSRAPRRS